MTFSSTFEKIGAPVLAHQGASMNRALTGTNSLRESYDTAAQASSSNSNLDAALAWARAGWRVFPLVPGGKEPASAHGFYDATTDEAQIRRWWQENPDCNIGVRTGEGLVVLDVDQKHGKNGWLSLAAIGLPREFLDGLDTFRVATPENGCHFWFRSDEPVQNGQDVLGKGSGVDIRAERAYVTAPPSLRPEGHYFVASYGNACDADDHLPRLSKLAPWSALGGKIHRPLPPTPPPPAPADNVPPVSPEIVARARLYLAACPPAISGQAGHNNALKTASALVNGFRLDPQTALQLLREDWNVRCQPSWTDKELLHKVSEAAKLGPPADKQLGWLLPNGHTDGRTVTSPANGEKGGRPPLDCAGIATEYLAYFDTAVRWCHGSFYEYDRRLGFWRIRNAEEMGARVAAFLNTDPVIDGKPVRYSRNLEANIVGSLRGTADLDLAPPCFLDSGKPAAGWAALENGLLDIEAAARGHAELHPFTPNFFSTRHFPFKWDPTAKCPRFMRFLEEVQPDVEGRKMLQLLAGLTLIPDTSWNVFFILLGEGGCGKSTFLRLLEGMLGKENVCAVTLQEMNLKHTAFRLTQTLANLVDDSATVEGGKFGPSLAGVEGLLKRVTSGALIHCEPKNINPWEAPATARCVFAANPPLPQFSDRSTALWDRLRIIPFTQRFRDSKEQEIRLAEKILAEEQAGMFVWAVLGLGELLSLKRFPQCPAGQKIIDEHREVCDREKLFLLDHYEFRQGDTCESLKAYQDYVKWCQDNGYVPKNNGNFAGEVRRVFPGVIGPRKTREDGIQRRRYLNLAPIEEPSFVFRPQKTQTYTTSQSLQDLIAGVPRWNASSRGTDGEATKPQLTT